MIRVPGYNIIETLHEGTKSQVYRALHNDDQKPVILKTSTQAYTSPDDIARLRYEFQILRNLSIPQVIRAFDLQQIGSVPVLILEDWQGISLDRLYDSQPMDLETFLSTAVQLTIIIGNLHQKGYIHRNIHPGNLVWNQEFQMLQLIDFSFTSKLLREKHQFNTTEKLEGWLAYISPEQTGRMNRMVDYRSDFYSLGATFYKLVTGQVPFKSSTPLEVIHCHIAKLPKPPHKVNSDIPRALSEIILKLLSKEAKERYQGSYGIRADLETCLKQLQEVGTISYFSCGKQDLAEHFQLPQKLYGRDEEITYLADIYDKICHFNRKGMVMVSGYAGIGKSSLVFELQKSIVKSHGYFISGKYDQFKQDIPYYGIVQAFRELIRQILGEPPEKLEQWKNKLLTALGPNGQIIIDVIPKVKLIIGDQPPIVELGPTETKNRFILVFQSFISVFAQPEHPLVIFLDDLQNADSSTFQLLEQIIANETLTSILLIGAYRSNEVGDDHVLHKAVAEIELVGKIHRLFLEPLPLPIVQTMLCDTLDTDKKNTNELSRLIHQKTRGNPFYVGELLQYLVDNNVLRFDSAKGAWEWDLDTIKTLKVAKNVVDFVLTKMDKLTPESRRVISLAACIGNQVDLKTLATISQQSPTRVNKQLWTIIQEGMLLPQEKNYELWSNIEELSQQVLDDKISINFQFQHDRVQQAAYSLIPEKEKSNLHYQIGRLMLESTSPGQLDEAIFMIVHQLNSGRDKIRKQEEKWELARLNLTAGSKAKSSIAYRSALQYLKIAKDLLPEDCWETDYEFCLILFKELADCAYSCGELDEANTYGRVLMENARHQLEKTDVLYMQLLHYTVMGKSDEAVKAGVEGLSRLGLVVPVKPKKAIIYKEFALIKWKMRNRKIKQLIDLPEMKGEKRQMIIRILMQMIGPAFISCNINLYVFLCLKAVNLSLRYGNAKESAFAYTCYGMFLGAMFNDFRSGMQFGKLGLELNEKSKNLDDKCRINFFYTTMIHSWNKPWKTMSVMLKEGIDAGYQTGDIFYMGNSYNHIILWDPDIDLTNYIQEEAKHLALLKETRYLNAWESSKFAFQLRSNLRGLTSGMYSLSDDSFNENECLQRNKKDAFIPGITKYYLYKMQMHFFYEDYETAHQLLKEVDKGIDALFGLPYTVEHCIFAFLTLSTTFQSQNRQEKKRSWRRINKEYLRMKQWSENCPENFSQHRLLMEAELARISGRVRNAAIIYDQAVESAQKSGFLQYEALANEITAKFYLNLSRKKMAGVFLRDARDCYLRWGATAKVEHLEKSYPILKLLSDAEDSQKKSLDIYSVVKASRAISEEIVLEKLLEKLLTIVIENAGAKRAVLLFEENGNFLIKAKLELEGSFSLKSIPLEKSLKLPKTVIQFAIRTQEVLLLPDAASKGDFTSDPVIVNGEIKSILCIPIKRQEKLICLLYLENNLIADAFTPEQVEMLNLLSAQVAIYIENARLYKELEKSLHQEQLARRAQEKLDQLKDEFLANTSHELRTPLHGMIGLAESLMGQNSQSLGPEVLSSLQTISYNGRRLSNLVNDLLDYSKMKHMDISLNLQAANLWEMVEMVLSLNKPLIVSKQLKAYNEITTDTPAVLADENRVQQILNNLIGNAIKFTDQGEIRIVAEAGVDQVEVTVEDSGVGIEQRRLSEIFEPFNQGDGSNEREHGGTGIGLSITKHLVELHKGNIRVESAPGKGSRFIFTLPIAKGEEAPIGSPHGITRFTAPLPQVEESKSPNLASGENGLYKILMVDDEPTNLQVLQNYLAGEPYITMAATSGQEALELLEKNGKPDLILLDVMMPKMSGFDVCREIRKTMPSHQLPILFLTARNQVPSLLEGFSAGANDYLPKPFSREELLVRVQFHLELALVTRKLNSLRTFSNQIGVFKDKLQIARSAYSHIKNQVPSSFACLLSDNAVVEKSIRNDSDNNEINLPLELLPTEQNPIVLENMDPAHWQINGTKAGSLLYFQWDEFQFFLFREPNIRGFTSQDLEYIKTFLNEIRIVRKNIHAVIFQTEPELLEKLIQIRVQINQIMYLTISKPNTEVVFTDPAKTLALRLSLQNIEIFFEEDTFLRVHRSYLLNPKYIKKIIRDSKVLSGYKIKISDNQIPIGKTYLPALMKKYPQWF